MDCTDKEGDSRPFDSWYFDSIAPSASLCTTRHRHAQDHLSVSSSLSLSAVATANMKVDLHLSSQLQLLPGPKLLSLSERGCYDRSGRLLHPRISPFTDGALHLMGPGRRVRHKSNDSSPLAICCNNFLTNVEP